MLGFIQSFHQGKNNLRQPFCLNDESSFDSQSVFDNFSLFLVIRLDHHNLDLSRPEIFLILLKHHCFCFSRKPMLVPDWFFQILFSLKGRIKTGRTEKDENETPEISHSKLLTPQKVGSDIASWMCWRTFLPNLNLKNDFRYPVHKCLLFC